MHHLNNGKESKDSNQATMNNIGIKHGWMWKEPDNQSDCCFCNYIQTGRRRPLLGYDSDSDPAYHFSCFEQDRFEARLADARDVEYCDPLWLLGAIPYFQDNFGLHPTFTWTGGEDIPDCDNSSSTKRGKFFECVCEPLQDNDGVKRPRFTYVWTGISVYLIQPPESSNSTSTCVQKLFWKGTD